MISDNSIEYEIRGTINIEKGTDDVEKSAFCDNRSKMERELVDIISQLKIPSDEFNREECVKVLDKLFNYLTDYDRILYSTISNIIFDIQKSKDADQIFGNLLSNLESIHNISTGYIKNKQRLQKKDDEDLPKLEKIILKIWDHINLAQQQYKELHLSDQEYQEKFENRMLIEKEKLYRDINSHMVTMIGIFTALSFVIFGGINSIETAFSGIEDTPITKLMVIGSMWGFGLLNLVYVFLYCIAKLTGLNFKNNTTPDANFYKRYQFIVVTNIAMIFLLLISLWTYFVTSNNLLIGFVTWFQCGSMCFVLFSIGVFICSIYKVWEYVSKKLE